MLQIHSMDLTNSAADEEKSHAPVTSEQEIEASLEVPDEPQTLMQWVQWSLMAVEVVSDLFHQLVIKSMYSNQRLAHVLGNNNAMQYNFFLVADKFFTIVFFHSYSFFKSLSVSINQLTVIYVALGINIAATISFSGFLWAKSINDNGYYAILLVHGTLISIARGLVNAATCIMFSAIIDAGDQQQAIVNPEVVLPILEAKGQATAGVVASILYTITSYYVPGYNATDPSAMTTDPFPTITLTGVTFGAFMGSAIISAILFGMFFMLNTYSQDFRRFISNIDTIIARARARARGNQRGRSDADTVQIRYEGTGRPIHMENPRSLAIDVEMAVSSLGDLERPQSISVTGHQHPRSHSHTDPVPVMGGNSMQQSALTVVATTAPNVMSRTANSAPVIPPFPDPFTWGELLPWVNAVLTAYKPQIHSAAIAIITVFQNAAFPAIPKLVVPCSMFKGDPDRINKFQSMVFFVNDAGISLGTWAVSHVSYFRVENILYSTIAVGLLVTAYPFLYKANIYSNVTLIAVSSDPSGYSDVCQNIAVGDTLLVVLVGLIGTLFGFLSTSFNISLGNLKPGSTSAKTANLSFGLIGQLLSMFLGAANVY